ncbi:IS3 family transposase [Ferrigenium sp. UT5]
MRYARIEELRQHHPVATMCRILEVSESNYHAWRQRPPSARQQENLRLETEIKAAHPRTRETYGPERLQSYLSDHGIQTSIHRIKRIRTRLGLRCKQKRKFKATTNSNPALPLAPNLLDRQFKGAAPNRAWVTDITYVATDVGWLYLAGIRDLFNGELVGYAMSERMTTNRVSQALFRAVAAKRPGKGLIHHADRGSQYCAYTYQQQLQPLGMPVSMSRKGDCWDNAPMESFWGSLKNELVHHRRFVTREQAKREITEYIEIFYNRMRKQARLGYLSPAAFSQQYYAKQMAA